MLMKKSPVFITLLVAMAMGISACDIWPRSTLKDCREQCKDSKKSKACYEFCDCIHNDGQSLTRCLEKYDKAPADSVLATKQNK